MAAHRDIAAFDIACPSEAAALLTLELIEPSRLPSFAEALLVRDYDAKSLRRLAVEEPGGNVDLVRLFHEANRALGGQEFATANDAATWLLRDLAVRIAEHTLDAYTGAKIIWMISLAGDVERPLAADPFIYCASEYEDRPEDRQFFTDAIIAEARRLVESANG